MGRPVSTRRVVQRGGRLLQHGPRAFFQRARARIPVRLAILETGRGGPLRSHSDAGDHRHLQERFLRLRGLPDGSRPYTAMAADSRVRGRRLRPQRGHRSGRSDRVPLQPGRVERRREGHACRGHALSRVERETLRPESRDQRSGVRPDVLEGKGGTRMNFVALRMLTGDRAKYFGLVFAIAFCTFLLENQTSIFANILRRTASQILDVTDAEVWVMDPMTEYWDQTKALKDTDLTRVRGVPGVGWAVRLFKGNPVARTRSGRFAASFLIGLDDATLAGAPRKMILGSWERLREPASVVVDQAGYILLFPDEPLALGRTLEMNDHRVTIVGISDAAAPFASLPLMHTRYSEAVNFLGHERTELSFIIARAARGLTPAQLTARIEEIGRASCRGRG